MGPFLFLIIPPLLYHRHKSPNKSLNLVRPDVASFIADHWVSLPYRRQFSIPACIVGNGFVWSPGDNEALSHWLGEEAGRQTQLWQHRVGWELEMMVWGCYAGVGPRQPIDIVQ